MIDFRYHLVSIIAVFFALAVGIVLGAGPLGAQVDENLPEQLAAVRDENQSLRDQIRALEAEQESRDGFVDAIAESLVGTRLADRDVLMVALPEAEEELVEATGEVLELAGATITTTVQMDPSWADRESEAALDALAANLVSSGTVLPEEGNGYDRGAAVLAGAFLRRPVDPTLAGGLEETQSLLNVEINEETVVGLEEAGFIEVDEPERKASLAVIVAGGTVDSDEEDLGEFEGEPWLSLVGALESAGGGAVVSGPASAADASGLLGAIRTHEDLVERVSTVDSISLPGGRIAVVFAVIEQENGGVGQYGYVDAEDGLLPPIPPPADPENPEDTEEEPPADEETTEDGESGENPPGDGEDGE